MAVMETTAQQVCTGERRGAQNKAARAGEKQQRKEVNPVNNYAIQIEIPEGRVKEILDKMSDAQRVIRECYDELEHLGILTVKRTTDNKGDR